MDITVVVVAVVALAAGWLAAWLVGQRRISRMDAERQAAIAQRAMVEQQRAEQRAEAEKAAAAGKEDMHRHYEDLMKERDERHADQMAALQQRLDEAERSHQNAMEEQRRHYEARMAEQGQRHSEDRQALEQRFNEMVKMVREQMENATGKMLKERQDEFALSSKSNLDGIINPLKETIEKMKTEMEKNSNVHTQMSVEIKTNMENMIRQSVEAQRSAEELTRAFKHESKTQGDWGEVVLSNLLAAQGFTEGKDFETQAIMRDSSGSIIQTDDGRSMIPDVLLHLDGERDVIIDSKVSMTAYINYVNAEDEAEKRQYLKEHIASLKKHVDELASKDYTQYQAGPHIDFVIMFVPQVQALWAATGKEPSLWQEAMQKRVFIADEQTLYAALRIIRISWTHIDQERNHQRLFELAQEMVNRTGDFLKEFDSIGRNLQQALSAYEDGKKKLLPGGHSIGTTARKILGLGGVNNSRASKSKRAVEPIIPLEYIDGEELPLVEGGESEVQPTASAERSADQTETLSNANRNTDE